MFKIKNRGVGLAILLLLVTTKLQAQTSTSALERIVTVNLYNEPPKGMLDLIGRQASVVFSYSPKVLDGRAPVTLDANQQPIRMVLYLAFGETVRLKDRGKYIIILDNRMALQQPFGDKPQVVEGYITDPKTGQKVSNATVYDKELMVSATTDQYGYFKLKVPYGEKGAKLRVSKMGYADTTIVPLSASSNFVSLNLPALAIPTTAEAHHKRGILGVTFPKWLLSEELWTNSVNIGDTIYRSWQVSFLPYIGTNHRLSGNVVNAFSLNIIGGYSQGVSIAEIGGIVNITRKDARYFMASGANHVGGHMLGVQLAGIYNRTQSVTGFQAAGVLNQSFGKVRGVQLSGIASITPGSLQGVQISGVYSHNSNNSGVQLSGIASISQQLHGTQISGIANYGCGRVSAIQLAGVVNVLKGTVVGAQISDAVNVADTVKGVQLGSVVNITHQSLTGAQVSGILNMAKGDSAICQVAGVANVQRGTINGAQVAGVANQSTLIKGSQIAGVTNLARKVSGTQCAGIYNQADTLMGVQVAGVVNRAKLLSGFQIGLVNLADSGNGMAVGLFSYIKKGYHRIEVSSDELMSTGIAFRSGHKKLHNIISAGVHLDGLQRPIWSIGYGFGSSWGVSQKMDVDLELHSKSIIVADRFEDDNDHFQLYVGLNRSLGKRRSVALGVTTNVLRYRNASATNDKTLENAIPYTLWSSKADAERTICGWIGGRVAFRF